MVELQLSVYYLLPESTQCVVKSILLPQLCQQSSDMQVTGLPLQLPSWLLKDFLPVQAFL